MARVDNNGMAIHYEVEGSGPPVVLMHGMGGSIQNWVRAGYVDALRDEFQLILVETRAHLRAPFCEEEVQKEAEQVCALP